MKFRRISAMVMAILITSGSIQTAGISAEVNTSAPNSVTEVFRTEDEEGDSSSESDVVTFELKNGTLTISGTGVITQEAVSDAVYDYSTVTNIVINDGITEIGEDAFEYYHYLKSVTIPDSVTVIGGYAFYYCDELSSVNLPSGLKQIGSSAFYNCDSLTSIEIPESTTKVNANAFAYCNNLKTVTITSDIEGGQYNGIFDGCSIKELIISDNVTRIEALLIDENSEAIESVTIPENINYFSNAAFSNGSVKELIFLNPECEIENNVYHVYKNTMYTGYEGSTAQEYSETYSVPFKNIETNEVTFEGKCGQDASFSVADGVLTISGSGYIDDVAFYNLKSVTSVVIEEGITSIGDSAFSSCENIVSVSLPESLKSMGYSVFSECSSLKEINIPAALTKISEFAFESTGFETFTVPETVKYIKYGAYSSENLKEITILNPECDIYGSAFSNYTVIVGYKDSTAHKWALENYAVFRDIETGEETLSGICGEDAVFEVKDGVMTISGTGSLENELINVPEEITEVIIQDGITSIGDRNFSEYDKLEKITIADSVKTIGSHAFYYCSLLENVTLSDGLTKIGSYAFSNCSSLKSVEIPDSVTEIGSYAFYYCTSLESVKIPENTEKIETYTFYECSALKSVTVPESVKSIAENSFSWCNNLKEITVLNKDCEMPDYSFCNSSVILTGYTGSTLESYAASHSNKFKDIETGEINSSAKAGENAKYTFEDGVLYVKGTGEVTERVPYSMNGDVKSIIIEEGITALKESVFDNCYYAESISLPSTLESFEPNLFSWNHIRNVEISENNKYYSADDDFIFNNDKTALIMVLPRTEEVNIPETVTTICSKAFNYYKYNGYSNNEKVIIPENVKSIEALAFDNYRIDTVIIKSADCVIEDSEDTFTSNISISGYAESTAEAYADKYERRFVNIKTGEAKQSGKCGENATFTVTGSTLKISGTGAVENCSFSGKSHIEKIIIDDGITSIGDNIFEYFTTLQTVEMPDTVETIGKYAFYECYTLKDVKLPESLKSIGSYAFSDCENIIDIVLPESVESVGDYAFYSADYMKKLTVKNPKCVLGEKIIPNYTDIEGYEDSTAKEYAEENINKFINIETGEVTQGGKCGENLTFSIQDGVLTISGEGEMTSSFNDMDDIISVVIEEGVTSLCSEAFYNCDGITSVSLPSTLTYIGSYAFEYCDKLKEIVIPEGAGDNLTVYASAFYSSNFEKITFLNKDCVIESSYNDSSQKAVIAGYKGSTAEKYAREFSRKFLDIETGKITVAGKCGENAEFFLEDNTLTITGTGAIYSGALLSEGNDVENIIINEGITEITDKNFADFSNLKSITIPSTVEKINYRSFSEDKNLKTVNIAEGNKNFCFTDGLLLNADKTKVIFALPSVKKTEIPSTVTEIEEFAFFDVDQLEEIVLPESVTKVQKGAFAGCDSLTKLTVMNKDCVIDHSAITICNSYYSNEHSWDRDPDEEISYSNIKYRGVICGYADSTAKQFAYDFGIKFMNIETGEIIQRGQCGDNLSYTIRNGILFIEGTGEMYDKPSFSGNTDITDVSVDEGVTSIGSEAFSGCSRLRAVSLPSTIKTVGSNAFYECDSLNSISFSEGLEEIGEYAFYDCDNLRSAIIPGTVKNIGTRAFYYSKLNRVVLGEGIENISEYAFSNTRFSEVVIPASVKYIGENAFESYYSSSTVNISILNPDCQIYDSEYTLGSKNALISGYEGSTAEEFAYNYGNKFCNLETGDIKQVGTCGPGLEYSIVKGELIITGKGKMYDNPTFNGNSSIKKVTIGDEVTSIGENAFNGTDIISITIPKGIETISEKAFLNAGSLSSIKVSDENEHFSSDNGVLFNKDGSVLVYYPEGKRGDTYTVPEGVNEIAEGAFYSDYYSGRRLNKLIIPNTECVIKGVFESKIVVGGYAGSTAETFAYDNNSYFYDIDTGKTTLRGRCGSGLTYVMTLDGDLVISGTGSISSNAFYGNDDIKSVVINEGVNTIGSYAFYDCDNLSSIKLPSTLKGIDYDAFNDTAIKEVSLPEGLEYISSYAFAYTPLVKIDIPASVSEISDYAFYRTNNLTAINVAEGSSNYASEDGVLFDKNMEEILMYPIEKNDTEYTVPKSVKKIVYRYGLFNDGYRNVNLKYLTIENPECQIEDSESTITKNIVICGYKDSSAAQYAYDYGRRFREIGSETIVQQGMCGPELTYDISTDGVLTISGKGTMYSSPLFSGNSQISKVIIEEGVTSIGNHAFDGCSNIESVSIPETVISIGDYAFNYCKSLTEINIPASVVTIGDKVFYDCNRLSAINVADKNTNYESVDGVLYDKGKIELICYPSCKSDTEFTIPTSVAVIGDYAFADCDNLVKVSMPVGVEKIGYYAFDGCNSLESAELPDTVNSIGNAAFRNCYRLKSVNIPNGVKKIGDSTFYSCDDLEEIVLPESVGIIEYNAFCDCYSLDKITIMNKDCNINDENSTLSNNAVICGNDDSTAHEFAMKYGRLFEDIETGEVTCKGRCGTYLNYEIKDGVLTISGQGEMFDNPIFSGNTKIKSVIIEEGVTTIGANAFRYCRNLSDIKIASTVSSIGEGAFYECYSLKAIELPDAVTEIGSSAFENCNSIKSVIMPKSLRRIGSSAFESCNSLSEVKLNDELIEIGANAFSYCSSLEGIMLPNSLEIIDSRAFNRCIKLKVMKLPASLGYFAPDALTNSGVTEILADEKNDVYSSEDGILYSADRKTLIAYPYSKSGDKFTIPESVENISEYSLRSEFLTEITIPETVSYIGTEAISGYSLENVIFEGNDCVIADSAIYSGMITAHDNSSAEEYANENGRWFTSIDSGKTYRKGNSGSVSYTIEDGTATLSGFGSIELSDNTIEKVIIGSGITSVYIYSSNIAEYVVDSENEVYSSENGVLYNKDKTRLIRYPQAKKDTEFVIPDSVENVNSIYNDNIKSLTLGKNTLLGYTEKIYDDDGKVADTVIRYSYEISAPNLEKITVASGNQYHSAENGVLFDKDKKYLVFYPQGKTDKEYVIPDSVENIYTIRNKNIESLTIGKNISFEQESKYIDEDGNEQIHTYYNFNIDCDSLSEIKVEEGSKYNTAVDGVLYNKDKTTLIYYPRNKAGTSFTVPSETESINMLYSNNLKQIEIGENVTNIRSFYSSDLESISVSDKNKVYSSESGILYYLDEEGKYAGISYVPNNVKGNITIPDGIVRIENSEFEGRSKIKSVTLPESVKFIGPYAFADCESLEELIITNPECEFYFFGNESFGGSNEAKYIVCNSIEKEFDEYGYPIYYGDAVYNGRITAPENSIAKEYADFFGYKFKDINSDDPEPDFLLGDVDGDGTISAMDASAALTYYVMQPESIEDLGFPFDIKAADWDGNGVIDSRDASGILSYYVSNN